MAPGYKYNYLLKLGLQKMPEGELPPDVEATPAEINTLQGINTEKTVQQQIDGLQNYADISVATWTEFLAAVAGSQSVPCRIHFTTNIIAESVETLDLSNCQIYGHYNKWLVNGNTITLTGNYASFNDVWFQGAANGAASTPAFILQGTPYTSCNFYFDNCRIYNFLETNDNNIFARIIGGIGASVHTILIRCVVNGESTATNTRTLAIYKVSGAAVSLKVDSLYYSGKPQDTNKLSMQMSGGEQDMFISDGSCEYTGTKPAFFFQWGNAQASDINNAIQTAETNAKNLANASGTLAIANGGTGATTATAARYNINNSLPHESSSVNDNTPILARYYDPSAANGGIYCRNASTIWNYIKNKIYSSTLPANGDILTFDANNSNVLGSTMSQLLNTFATSELITEADYQALVAAGTVDPTKLYITY